LTKENETAAGFKKAVLKSALATMRNPGGVRSRFQYKGFKPPGTRFPMIIRDEEVSIESAVERSLAYAAGLARRHDIAEVVNAEMAGRASSNLQARVAGIFGDRVKAEKAIMRQILREINQREDIHLRAIRDLDERLLQCENWLGEIKAIREGSYVPGPEDSLLFGPRRTALEQKILDLKSERRAEESEAWRDLSTLRRYLLFSFKDFHSASRRSELLRWGPGTSDETVSE